MKVGILTYHRVVNDGSVIQAYCLQQLLCTIQPNIRVEIVDYRPFCGEIAKYRRIISRRLPLVQVQYWHKLRSVHQFLKHYSTLSPSCTTDNLDKACKFIQAQGYDAVVVGSDTVWEARTSTFAPPAPNLYYLPNILGIKKLAFAASADPILPEYIRDEQRTAQIHQAIEAFDFISVRDEATKNHLINLGLDSQQIHFMPDPTLLYDFSSLADKPIMPRSQQKPLAGISIGVSDGRISAQIVKQLQQSGYDVIFLTNPAQIQQFLGHSVRTVNQRLGIHAVLDLIVTDRFHSSIFALIMAQSPVIFVETHTKWPQPNSKGRDLFRRLGIEPMVWRYEGCTIPYDLIQSRLNIWPELSSKMQDHLCIVRESANALLVNMFE